ncbi:unnamed protein product [Microthlaspi erraticum]|uniref:Glycine-rich protein n=1 Tax=Microthlaspi erraticum TaxID=1685480 RepID=A0A6D2IIA0_9BRAS|nr:unnamed protein product [Microthlaspi erraticum]
MGRLVNGVGLLALLCFHVFVVHNVVARDSLSFGKDEEEKTFIGGGMDKGGGDIGGGIGPGTSGCGDMHCGGIGGGESKGVGFGGVNKDGGFVQIGKGSFGSSNDPWGPSTGKEMFRWVGRRTGHN